MKFMTLAYKVIFSWKSLRKALCEFIAQTVLQFVAFEWRVLKDHHEDSDQIDAFEIEAIFSLPPLGLQRGRGSTAAPAVTSQNIFKAAVVVSVRTNMDAAFNFKATY